MLRVATTKAKFALLRRRLGSHYRAVGLLESLWHVAATNAPDGGIGRMTDAELEAIVEWDGEPGALVEIMVETRWIDRVEGPVRLYVHDWQHHADESVHRKLARERRFFADGTAPNVNYLTQKERHEAATFYSHNTALAAMDRDVVAIDRDAKSSGQVQVQVQEQRPGAGAVEEAAAPPARNPVVNLLRGGDPPADADEREAWWATEGPRIEAEAVARSPDGATPKQVGAKVKSIALGWWQTYLRGAREFRGIAERFEREARMAAWEAEQLPRLRAVEERESKILAAVKP